MEVGAVNPVTDQVRLIDHHIHLENGPLEYDWLHRFWTEAKKGGLAQIGISEHSFRFVEAWHILDLDWAKPYCDSSVREYVRLCRLARDTGLDVKMGIEVDYVPGKEREIERFLRGHPWDYVIGSVHWDGPFPFDQFDVEWTRPVYEVYRRYYDIVVRAVESGLFDVLGHLDVVKVTGKIPEEDVGESVMKTLDAVLRTGICVEVNTAGWRKPAGEQYPSEEILRVMLDKNIPITLSSDAHFPEDVGRDFDRLLRLVWGLGYKEYVTFQARSRVPVSLTGAERSRGGE